MASKKKAKSDTVRIKFHLSIGYPGANQEATVEYNREDWESFTEDEKHQELMDWVNNHIDACFEEEDD